MATRPRRLEMVGTDDVIVLPGRRPLNGEAVESLMSSMQAIGLRTPISVRMAHNVTDNEGCFYDKAYVLVTGAHRLEAACRLGWDMIEAFETDADETQAELWEIAENLHRADLTKDERDRQIRRYAELLRQTGAANCGGSLSDGRAAGPQHMPGVSTIIAKETGISKDTVERALNPERVAAERARSKIDKDVKERAANEVASMLAEHVPGEWWDALKANLYAAGAANIATALTNITGQSIMDRRYGT